MNPIKIGIIGVGRAGSGMHANALSSHPERFTFTACCDIRPEKAAAFSEKFGCKAYEDFHQLIADPEVELVDIATFSRDHYEHAKAALLAGKNVFVEKPFVMGTKQAKELIRLGSQPGGPHLYIRHNRRFEEGFETVNEIIDSGILGEVYEIKLTRNGFNRRNDWQTLEEFGGGQIFNWGPHIIDHSLRFCGGDYVELFSDLKHVVWAGDRDDHIKLVFKGVNQRIVDMEISGGAAVPTPEYIVYGTRGGLISEGTDFRLRYLDPNVELPPVQAIPGPAIQGFANPETLTWVEEVRPAIGRGIFYIWDALYEAIRLQKPFPIKLEQAYKVIEVIEKARKGTIFESKASL